MFGRGKKAKAQNLMATGHRAVGVVTDVRDTGMTINDNPRVKLTFRLEPLDGTAPFEVRKTATVSRVAIPRPGDRYAAWYDAADRDTWMYATVADDTGRQQIRTLFGAAAETLTGIATAPTPAATTDPLQRLQQLDALHAAGVVDDTEHAAAKARILAEV